VKTSAGTIRRQLKSRIEPEWAHTQQRFEWAVSALIMTAFGRLLPVITRGGRAGQWDDLKAERGSEAVEFWLLRSDIRVADLLHIGKLDLISTT
jgi:hypothetical protein